MTLGRPSYLSLLRHFLGISNKALFIVKIACFLSFPRSGLLTLSIVILTGTPQEPVSDLSGFLAPL